jgi:histone-lysine N-methyltransferase SETD1
VLSIQNKTLSYQPVTLTVQQAVKSIPASARAKGELKPEDIIEQARVRIVRELKGLLEKDVVERIVSGDVTKLVGEMKQMRRDSGGTFGGGVGGGGVKVKGWSLKGLSFKKQKKEVVVEQRQREDEAVKPKVEKVGDEDEEDEEAAEDEEEDEEEEEEEEIVDRPKKKRRKELGVAIVVKRTRRVVDDDDIESEEEDLADFIRLAEITGEAQKKRNSLENVDEDGQQPVKKKLKVERGEKLKKGATRRSRKVVVVEEEVQVPVTPSESRSPSPVPKKRKPRVVTPPPTPPPPDPLESGLCEDDEDLYYVKLALSGLKSKNLEQGEEEEEEEEKAGGIAIGDDGEIVESATFRKHVTGSARTEGYYKITHTEKAAYVAQYQARTAAISSAATPTLSDEPQQPQHITSSRSNRANARRRAQGLEEINQFQRAVALSMGETAATANELTFIKFNQLQTRKKHLRFAKSPIHDWGLYAMERIARGEMVIEYVGEVIRAAVADKREKAYERQGIGSSYLFRIDEDLVVDATKKGNLGYVSFVFLRCGGL